ncbi:hypothetical protein MKX64_15445 [Paenibacillus sp. FSL M8-0334]|uniref:hypothetical protein n=1 Tax=Paenibacillus sp. FSL M8-0334 TaxID=2921623 RepID=UPI0030F9C601
MPFSSFMKDRVTLIKQNGEIFENIKAMVDKNKIHIDDSSLPIEEGDRIVRTLKNNLKESYIVEDRGYFEAFHGIKAHYQVDVRRESSVPRNFTQPDGRGYVVHVNGSNARVNINSQDYSTNTVTELKDPLFEEMRQAISTQIEDINEKQKLLNCVEELESSKGTTTFMDKYKSFMTMAADHMTVLTPFIGPLSSLL